MGRQEVRSADSSVRQGLNDALTDVPSGVGGVTQSAGWSTVKGAMRRPSNRGEEIFATGGGTNGSPGDLVFEGVLTRQQIQSALTL